MDLQNVMAISASGMKAQGVRLKVIAENLANANTTAETPGDLPYRRKVVIFKNELDRALGTDTVRAAKIDVDKSDFQRRYDPTHPSADADGYVLLPNVNSIIESMDMREAQRSYEANVSVVEAARTMLSRTIEVLRG
ncbi:flagellar basal body rod protein FlgC [Azospirillum sp. RWY-5-1]|uniref:Flagellar basal-body rod protein FlgC n=1 Tax=Azospirillum oleiclasticum TaxID=2735135 RepID=A0ABX2T3V1_9PROT|nr:flagellar basal body rod protein FlgC [Azospirillum oleiclasticum]NYZ11665.1 flagellar basal body rod protein FlgC [Azospirillum oleiclasticum]NYZ18826.1 flagellar basal body rod protein FlgC [Azospirillum oleiclasticum]